MELISVDTGGSGSRIYLGYNWENVREMLPGKSVIIITDNNVYDLYSDRFPPYRVLKLAPGEESKQLDTIRYLAEELLNSGIDRTGFILGIGGGVVCDITGFLASVFMRGVSFGFVSTTLLSQVDASTGGKNGVNLGEVKNVIGNFRQPEFVICDTAILKTLPDEEYLSGLAELIKTGIIGDVTIIDILEDKYDSVLKRDTRVLSELLVRSVKYKASVVSQDEKETGLRRVLNFGHTFGHAFELHLGIKHGIAVASGMELAAAWSKELGYLENVHYERIINILKKYCLLTGYSIPSGVMEELIRHDKKKAGTDIHFVFIEEPGKPLVKRLPVKEVIDFYRRINNR
ncbi:MAG TPA: 3-dehydroquinate synthase [Bacteroidales bacterium]|nr:3-dehydroquinate synthase [Bacteroidales bacterium]